MESQTDGVDVRVLLIGVKGATAFERGRTGYYYIAGTVDLPEGTRLTDIVSEGREVSAVADVGGTLYTVSFVLRYEDELVTVEKWERALAEEAA